MQIIRGIAEVRALVGNELGVSSWHEVTQEQINAFAGLSGDDNFIHVDPLKAQRTRFGGTIAHGYYVLCLMPSLKAEIARFEGFSLHINYGLNRVRFPAPLRVGATVRLRSTLDSVEEIAGGLQLMRTERFESSSGERPVCVAETVLRLYT